MESFALKEIPHQVIANFVAGVRFAARAKYQVTNAEIANAVQRIKGDFGYDDLFQVTGKQIVWWGAVEKLKTHPIDPPTLFAILVYSFNAEIYPRTNDGLIGLYQIHDALKIDLEIPEYIKKRLNSGVIA